MPVEHLTNGIHDTSTSLPPDFKAFKFIPKLIGDKNDSLNACLRMFEDLDIVEQFRPKNSTLRKFLQTVQKNYKQLPYHNWEHAFAVAHFCYLLLRTPKLKTQLNDLERLSLLVSSICHDLDHPGTSNSFQIQYKTPLADLYNNEGSILEKHHFAQTISILKSKECDIFEELSKEDFQHVMNILQDTIMATDIAVHFSSTMPRLKKTTEDKNGMERSFKQYMNGMTRT
uniref:3',5'-cyclic-nucleotide phosphodiesterase n=1 Tax=Acrobeloides nanus TaxID=290746 RepID=A0A914E834_9BILA